MFTIDGHEILLVRDVIGRHRHTESAVTDTLQPRQWASSSRPGFMVFDKMKWCRRHHWRVGARSMNVSVLGRRPGISSNAMNPGYGWAPIRSSSTAGVTLHDESGSLHLVKTVAILPPRRRRPSVVNRR